MRMVEPAAEPFYVFDRQLWSNRGLLAVTAGDWPLLILTGRYGQRYRLDFLDAGSGEAVTQIDLGPWESNGGDLRLKIAAGALIGGSTGWPLRRWAIPSGEFLGQWRAPRGWDAFDVTPDGSTVLLAVHDTVRQLDAATGRAAGVRLKARGRWSFRGERLTTVCSAGPWVVAGSWAGELWIWRASGDLHALHRNAHHVIVRSTAYEVDGRWYAATVGADNAVRLWDVESGEPIRRVTRMIEEPPWAAHAHGELLIAGDLEIRRFDPATGEPKGILARFAADDPDFQLGGDDEFAEFIDIRHICSTGPEAVYFSTPHALWRLPEGAFAVRADEHRS